MPAVAVTDTNNMFAALEFSETPRWVRGAADHRLPDRLTYLPPQPGERPRPPAAVVLLAQNEAGYLNLMKLNSCPIWRGRGVAAGDLEDLEPMARG
jgi:DNA polymerase III subunit alpha